MEGTVQRSSGGAGTAPAHASSTAEHRMRSARERGRCCWDTPHCTLRQAQALDIRRRQAPCKLAGVVDRAGQGGGRGPGQAGDGGDGDERPQGGGQGQVAGDERGELVGEVCSRAAQILQCCICWHGCQERVCRVRLVQVKCPEQRRPAIDVLGPAHLRPEAPAAAC